jgi:anti-anti-sigma factor
MRRLVIDLCDVTFLDSSGLNALVLAQRALAEKSIVFHVVVPTDSDLHRVFEITQLTASLSVVDTLQQALS